MDMNEYQKQAAATDHHDFAAMGCPGPAYLALALAGEAGELANKVKKMYRDNRGRVTMDGLRDITHELGDVLWYIAAFARMYGIPLDYVAEANLDKLASRQARGTIGGSGDHR